MSGEGPGVFDWLSRQDEQLARLIDLNEKLLQLKQQEYGSGEGDGFEDSTQSYLSGIDSSNIPRGWKGEALQDIPAGSKGDAEFNLAGNDVIVEVESTNTCEEGDFIEVVGKNNLVTSIEDGGSSGGVSISGTSSKSDSVTVSVSSEPETSNTEDVALIDLKRRRSIDIAYSLKSKGPNIEVQVSNDKSVWWTYETVNTGDQGKKEIILLDTSFRYVRAFVLGGDDNNVNKLVMSAKGI